MIYLVLLLGSGRKAKLLENYRSPSATYIPNYCENYFTRVFNLWIRQNDKYIYLVGVTMRFCSCLLFCRTQDSPAFVNFLLIRLCCLKLFDFFIKFELESDVHCFITGTQDLVSFVFCFFNY